MTRPALITSCLLHAGLMALVADWSHSTAPRDSGQLGIATSFSFGDFSEGSEPPLPEVSNSSPPAPEFLLAEPDFSLPIVAAQVDEPRVPDLASVPSLLPVNTNMANANSAMSRDESSDQNHRVVSRTKNLRGSSTGTAGPVKSDSPGGYVPPRFLLRYKPPYPAAARAERLEGTVHLLASVDPGGRVTRAEIRRSCGHALLDHAALDAVRSWRFEPAQQNGVALAAQVEVPVRFRFVERS